jgi:hypothetical protein
MCLRFEQLQNGLNQLERNTRDAGIDYVRAHAADFPLCLVDSRA